MKLYFCAKQKAVAAALAEGRWPQADDLRAHAAACRSCSDLVLVTQSLQQARRQTMQALNPEFVGAASSAALWWRAELRRRYGAVERMAKPIAFAEILALIGVPVGLVGLIVWQWDQITGWLTWLTGSWHVFRSDDLSTLLPATMQVMPLVLIASLGGLILISGLAWFLLTEKE